jgi:predicted TIM-barrel fold metal-dependent hydrolase
MKLSADKMALSPWHERYVHQSRRACSSASKAPRLAVDKGVEYVYVKSWAGWSPKYIPEALLREAATRLQDRVLFGSDYPFITPQRWLKDFEALNYFKPEVIEKLFWKNARRLLKHTSVGRMSFS